jgi:uncharacterized protein (TIGR00369 family)
MDASRFERRIRHAVTTQPIMALMGVSVVHAAPGELDLAFPFDERLTQQHGFLHAGVVATVADSACGFAAYSAAESEVDVLTVEFKINLLEPARGSRFIARGRVVRAGRRLTTCRGEVVAVDGDGERLVAISTTTMALRPRTGSA